jgi:hypothetical protein
MNAKVIDNPVESAERRKPKSRVHVLSALAVEGSIRDGKSCKGYYAIRGLFDAPPL